MTGPEQLPEDGERATRRESAVAIEELVTANAESNKTMLNLVNRVREETAARDRKVDALERTTRQMQWVIGSAAVLIAVLLVLAVFNAINLNETRKSQKTVAAIAESTQETNRTLLDCVNSTGQCGQVNQANQAKILDTVKLYELTVIYCARTNPQNVDPMGNKFVACVSQLYPGGPTLDRKGQ